MVVAPAATAREVRIDRGMRGRSEPRDVDRAIAAWAEGHFGLVSRQKLRALGLSEDQIDRRVRGGSLLVAVPGLYYVGHRSGVPGQREAVAVAGAGPGTVLAAESSSGWRGMTEAWRGDVLLIVPRARKGRVDGVAKSVARLGPGDWSWHQGLPCASPERTVMDLDPSRLRQALQWLMKRAIALEPIVERMRGRRGAKAFREAVAQLVPQLAHTMSELEARFVLLCRRHGLPLPVVNGLTLGRDLLDCTWPGSDLVVELDGRRWHEHRDREDRERGRRMVLAGRRLLRYDWWDVTTHELRTARELGSALA